MKDKNATKELPRVACVFKISMAQLYSVHTHSYSDRLTTVCFSFVLLVLIPVLDFSMEKRWKNTQRDFQSIDGWTL